MGITFTETTEKPPGSNDIRHRLPEYQIFLGEVKKNVEGYDIFVAHGSNSGSLPGFALERGLVPTGWMIEGRSQAVPFSGSLKGIGEGNIPGVNMRGISFTKPHSHEIAHWFATFQAISDFDRYNNSGIWTPEGAKEDISQMQEQLARIRVPHALNKSFIVRLQNTIVIEQVRLEAWENFSPQDKKLVQDHFAIVYGIPYRFAQQFIRMSKDLKYPGEKDSGEVFIEDKVEASQLTIFSPPDKIQVVKEYLLSKGLESVQVLNLSAYSFLVHLYEYLYPEKDQGTRLKRRFKSRFKGPHEFIEALKRMEVELPYLINGEY